MRPAHATGMRMQPSPPLTPAPIILADFSSSQSSLIACETSQMWQGLCLDQVGEDSLENNMKDFRSSGGVLNGSIVSRAPKCFQATLASWMISYPLF